MHNMILICDKSIDRKLKVKFVYLSKLKCFKNVMKHTLFPIDVM